MKNRISIYVGPPLARLLENEKNVTGRLNQVVDRYAHLIKKSTPHLSDQEKHILRECLSGSFIDPLFIEYLHDEIEDADLADKIKTLSFAEKLAIVESLGF